MPNNDIGALYFRIGSREFWVYRKRVNRIRNEWRKCFLLEYGRVTSEFLELSLASCPQAERCRGVSFCKRVWFALSRVWLLPLADRRVSNSRADTPREFPDGPCPQALDLEFRLVLLRIFQAAPARRLRQWKGLRHEQHSFAAAGYSRARDNERGNAWFRRGWYR